MALTNKWHVYGPGSKAQVLAEINRDMERGIVTATSNHSGCYDQNNDFKLTIMVKKNPNNAQNFQT